MGSRKRLRPKGRVSLGRAFDVLESVLQGAARREVVDHALRAPDLQGALRTLRTGMRAHVFPRASPLGPPERLDLDALVKDLDRRTRSDGFHVLLEWDGDAKRFLREPISVLLLDHFAVLAGGAPPERGALAVLLDHYFLYALALCALRAWDEGDPNENLDRVTALLGLLQGPGGSGFRFVDDAETLLFVATSHYEPDDRAYDRLLEKVDGLDAVHRIRVARMGASVLGCHLRWGFPAYYNLDLGLMRDDNVADYPWLLWSLLTLAEAWDRGEEEGPRGTAREDVVEALLNGFTPDPWAFTGDVPPLLRGHEGAHGRLRTLLTRHRDALLDAFGKHPPGEHPYSPLSFHFNFPHNVVTGTVTLALMGRALPNLPLNALLTRQRPDTPLRESPEILAMELTEYAATRPEERGGRRVMMVAYDPSAAALSYDTALEVLAGVGKGAAGS